MSIVHYYTENWIINSQKAFERFLDFAIDKEGNINESLKGQKILLVESTEDVVNYKPKWYDQRLKILAELFKLSRHLNLTFIVVTNAKPEYIEPQLRRYIEEFRSW